MKRKILTKKAFALFLASAMTINAIPVWANYGGDNPEGEEVEIEQNFETASLELTVGEEEDVTDYLYYTWDSYDWDYDSSMVRVSKGVITAKSDGYTSVTATHEYQVVTFKIGIEAAEKSNTEYVSVTVGVGSEEGLGQYIELGTSDYSWSSDNSSIASVTRGGVLTGNAKGSTKVYASRSTGTSFVFNVTVEGGGASKTSEKSITFNDGDIDYLSSYVGNDAADYKWTSSNSSVADISSSSKIVALKAGSATIKATPYETGTEYVFYITVKGSSAETRDVTIYVDDTKDLSSYVSGSASNYSWSSNDKSVATVSSD
ncbi:MAG: Ig-like domain-containing protein, partial [Firmicutes bacterium]|nr:Ig-like domain-containing protein [Bacillota bacterium]